MRSTVSMIGIYPEELRWMRMLLALLRHTDPATPELARQALLYLTQSADSHARLERQPAIPSVRR
jgi:hypothetical protein